MLFPDPDECKEHQPGSIFLWNGRRHQSGYSEMSDCTDYLRFGSDTWREKIERGLLYCIKYFFLFLDSFTYPNGETPLTQRTWCEKFIPKSSTQQEIHFEVVAM